MQGKEHLTGFNPDFLKEPLETFPSSNVPHSKWDSRNGLFNRKRLEMGLGDMQRQTFDCTSDEDVGSSIPSEVIDNAPISSTRCTKTKKNRRPAIALNELINQEKQHNKSVDSYKTKINHVLNLINSHSNQKVNQEFHALSMLPNFALVFLVIIFIISFCFRGVSHGIQSVNLKLFNFICCKKNLPLTCLALILYILLMILSAIISFLLNPIPKKFFEWLMKA